VNVSRHEKLRGERIVIGAVSSIGSSLDFRIDRVENRAIDPGDSQGYEDGLCCQPWNCWSSSPSDPILTAY
jgi:hypothetical protein